MPSPTPGSLVEILLRLVRVLSLAVLVEIKRASTHRKDQLALPVLEATLRRQGG